MKTDNEECEESYSSRKAWKKSACQDPIKGTSRRKHKMVQIELHPLAVHLETVQIFGFALACRFGQVKSLFLLA